MERKIFVVLATIVALMAIQAAADDTEAIRQLCRFRTGTYPHPNPLLCHLYVQCQLVTWSIRECQAGTIFVNEDGCIPGDRDTCEPFNPIFPTPPNPDSVCEGVDVAVFPDESSCTRYILCLFGTAENRTCPENMPVFDSFRKTCLPGNPLTCEVFDISTIPPTPTIGTTTTIEIGTSPVPTTQSTITITPPPIPTIPTIPPSGNVCSGFTLRFVADPKSCATYYLCLFGLALPRECDPDRIFWERQQRCVRGDQLTCIRNSWI